MTVLILSVPFYVAIALQPLVFAENSRFLPSVGVPTEGWHLWVIGGVTFGIILEMSHASGMSPEGLTWRAALPRLVVASLFLAWASMAFYGYVANQAQHERLQYRSPQ